MAVRKTAQRCMACTIPPPMPVLWGSGLPPAIISIHGGPTSQASIRYNGERNYFTSRGYGWLDVNHRGSSGYGRSYQQAMDGRWARPGCGRCRRWSPGPGRPGIGRRQSVDHSRGQRRRLYRAQFIACAILAQYRAGICLYGIGNLFTLAMETHKFELHYNDRMIGVLPEARDKFYGWSALFHAERIRDALALFHGSKDSAVPPAQSEEIAGILRANGVPHLFQLYEGEGPRFPQRGDHRRLLAPDRALPTGAGAFCAVTIVLIQKEIGLIPSPISFSFVGCGRVVRPHHLLD